MVETQETKTRRAEKERTASKKKKTDKKKQKEEEANRWIASELESARRAQFHPFFFCQPLRSLWWSFLGPLDVVERSRSHRVSLLVATCVP